MELIILGAAGATGTPLVEQALAAGHRVAGTRAARAETDRHGSQPPSRRR
jgi:nucleoside-diphosphate-sugar epimerase